MFQMGRKMCGLFRNKEVDGGDILRKFLVECQRFRSMPHDVVWRMLFFEARQKVSYKSGKVGRKRGLGGGQDEDDKSVGKKRRT